MQKVTGLVDPNVVLMNVVKIYQVVTDVRRHVVMDRNTNSTETLGIAQVNAEYSSI